LALSKLSSRCAADEPSAPAAASHRGRGRRQRSPRRGRL